MKLKKIVFSATLALASVFALASCGSSKKEITYTDSEGKVQKQVLQSTTDEKEVTKDVIALASTEYKVEATKSVQIEATFNADLNAKLNDKEFNIKADLSEVAAMQIPTYVENKSAEDYAKELVAYSATTLNATLPNGLLSGSLSTETQNVALKLNSYYESNTAYLNFEKLDLDLAKLTGVDLTKEPAEDASMLYSFLPMIDKLLKGVKGNTYKLSAAELEAATGMAGGLSGVTIPTIDEETIQKYVGAISQYANADTLNLDKINALLSSLGVKVTFDSSALEANVEKLVKEIGLTIKSVSGNEVTFAFNVNAKNDAKVSVELVLDVAKCLPVRVSVDLAAAVNALGKDSNAFTANTLKAEVKFTYNGSVNKISEDNKKAAKGIQDLMALVLGGDSTEA